MRREDVATIVAPLARRMADEIVAGHAKSIDVPVDLTLAIPTAIVTDYLVVDDAPASDLVAWSTLMFWYLFIDLAGDQALAGKALDAAAACRAAIDRAVAARKASGVVKDNVLGRCLVLGKADQPGMGDLGIRNNLIGLVIGAIPTISKACCQALDQLLDRPAALASAR